MSQFLLSMKFSLKKTTPDSPPPEEETPAEVEEVPPDTTLNLGDITITDVVSCKDDMKQVHMGYLNDQCYIVVDTAERRYVHVMAGRIKFTVSEEMTRMADRAFLVLTETLEPPKKKNIHLNTLQLDEDLSIKPTWRQGRMDLWYEYANSPQAFFKTVKRINELRGLYDFPRTINVIQETQEEKETSSGSGSVPSTYSADLSPISPATTQEEDLYAPPPDSPLPDTPEEKQVQEDTFDFDEKKEEEEKHPDDQTFDYPALYEQCEIIQEALDDPSTCDFIIASETGEIPVHSLILRARWPHFKLICDRDTTIDSEQNKSLSLSQHPHEWVKAMVDSIYGIDPEIDDFETLLKLMMFAEVYQVQQLHEFVNYKISAIKLTPELMCHLWKCAYTCDNTILMDRCASYYTRHMEEVESCTDFGDLTKPEITELLQHVRRSKPGFTHEQRKFGYVREHNCEE